VGKHLGLISWQSNFTWVIQVMANGSNQGSKDFQRSQVGIKLQNKNITYIVALVFGVE